MKIRFTKMHGNGNDFVVIDAIRQNVALDRERVRRIADRHFGVGCDQLLLVEEPTRVDADFRYRIFNADGGEVEQCGNGARCFTRFVRDQGLTAKDAMRVETASGIITPSALKDARVTIEMGVPRFEPSEIPFIAPRRAPTYRLLVDAEHVEIHALSMGNPHAVQFVDDVERAPVTTQGPLIERHADFPNRVNAGYAQILDRARMKLRVWERGAGETLSCGTGACAAVVAGISAGLLAGEVQVITRGGSLMIAWRGEGAPVFMTGDAVTVFHGEIEI